MHAYLESLLKFSDAVQEMVTVLYCETENIRYEKLIQALRYKVQSSSHG